MTLARRHRTRRDWSEAREKVALEGRCRHCGAPTRLEAAHVLPRSLGGRQNADSVIPLCRNCHEAQHGGLLELLPLLTRDEQVEAVRAVGLARAYRYLTEEAQ